MAIQETNSLLHWNYFLALESDVERLARFVEFTTDNFGAYSIEMAHLFLAAASEVDVVAKQLCSAIGEEYKASNIEQYRSVLRDRFPDLERSSVFLPRYGLELKPWDNWRKDETPDWWRAHNSVKHQRGEHFSQANLKNVLNAMAGLFLLILFYYRESSGREKIDQPPILFAPPLNLARVCGSVGGGIVLFFNRSDI